MNIQKVFAIIKKDFMIEMRQKHALASIVLFAITCGYIIYRTFGQDLSAQVWNILLWILILFAGLNAVVKSFTQERSETYLYYYSLFAPLEIIVAKLIYNFIFLFFLFLVLLGVFTVLLGNPISDYQLFFSGGGMGILGIASIFTFVALIASIGGNNSTMMSILALPLILPILLLLVKITSVSMNLMTDSAIYDDVMLILGIDMMMIAIILLIFPTMWRS